VAWSTDAKFIFSGSSDGYVLKSSHIFFLVASRSKLLGLYSFIQFSFTRIQVACLIHNKINISSSIRQIRIKNIRLHDSLVFFFNGRDLDNLFSSFYSYRIIRIWDAKLGIEAHHIPARLGVESGHELCIWSLLYLR
jgi:WD40 repeat protein